MYSETKRKEAQPTENIQENPYLKGKEEQKFRNSEKVKTCVVFQATRQLYKVCKNSLFNSAKPISRSSKLLAFLSHQRHHIKHKGTSFHNCITSRLPNCPLQQSISLLTLRGITQTTPNNCKHTFHISKATSQ
jgi:hypothetical protein